MSSSTPEGPAQDLLAGIRLQCLLQDGPQGIPEALRALEADLARQAAEARGGSSLASGNPIPCLNDPAVRGWSWAAFLGGGPWALAHRMPWLGLGLLLGFWAFPLPNLLLGRFGGQMAWRQRPFPGVEEFRVVQRAWARAGGLVVLAQLAGLAGAAWWFLQVSQVL